MDIQYFAVMVRTVDGAHHVTMSDVVMIIEFDRTVGGHSHHTCYMVTNSKII